MNSDVLFVLRVLFRCLQPKDEEEEPEAEADEAEKHSTFFRSRLRCRAFCSMKFLKFLGTVHTRLLRDSKPHLFFSSSKTRTFPSGPSEPQGGQYCFSPWVDFVRP